MHKRDAEVTMGKEREDEESVNEFGAELLLANASDFLNGAIELLFAKTADQRAAKIAVVSIQTAMELLAKYRLVRSKGAGSIMEGKRPASITKAYLRKGQFHTLNYNQTLTALEDIEFLNQMDRELMKEVAQLRNKLVHFAARVWHVHGCGNRAYLSSSDVSFRMPRPHPTRPGHKMLMHLIPTMGSHNRS
jgi:hypothetical protein